MKDKHMYTPRTFQKKDTAQKIIKSKTLYAAGIGLIPFPIVDAVGIIGLVSLSLPPAVCLG